MLVISHYNLKFGFEVLSGNTFKSVKIGISTTVLTGVEAEILMVKGFRRVSKDT